MNKLQRMQELATIRGETGKPGASFPDIYLCALLEVHP